jgi:hypothetical protein
VGDCGRRDGFRGAATAMEATATNSNNPIRQNAMSTPDPEPSIRPTPLLERCTTLGREFGRRRMRKHVAELRRFYVATRDCRSAGSSWNETFIDEWLAALQLPPFERALEVQARGVGCSRCNSNPGAVPSVRTQMVFPGGARMCCNECGRRWLEPE